MIFREYDIIRNDKNVCELKELSAVDRPYEYTDDLIAYLNEMHNMCILHNEKSYVIAFDDSSRVLGVYLESVGSTSENPSNIKEFTTFLLLTGATKFMLFHNHPNDELGFSEGDETSTWVIRAAIANLDIKFLDSIVIGKSGWYSSQEDEVYYYEDEE